MIDLSKVTTSDWISVYGAVLSSLIAIIAVVRFCISKYRARRERLKFKTDLYFLRKIDRTTKDVHPIVVVLLANLGSSRISLKSLEYKGTSENGLAVTGAMGWYEQPEELYGVRNRLLPVILESGETKDLPMVQIGVITRISGLEIWLTDFDDRKYHIEAQDIAKVRRDIEKYQNERSLPPPNTSLERTREG